MHLFLQKKIEKLGEIKHGKERIKLIMETNVQEGSDDDGITQLRVRLEFLPRSERAESR